MFSLFPITITNLTNFINRFSFNTLQVIKFDFSSSSKKAGPKRLGPVAPLVRCGMGAGFEQRPWTPTVRRGKIAAESSSPGPACVQLPSLLGKISLILALHSKCSIDTKCLNMVSCTSIYLTRSSEELVMLIEKSQMRIQIFIAGTGKTDFKIFKQVVNYKGRRISFWIIFVCSYAAVAPSRHQRFRRNFIAE